MLNAITQEHTVSDIWTQIGNRTAKRVESAGFRADKNVRYSFYYLWGEVIRVTVDSRFEDMPMHFVKGEDKDIFKVTYL
tara:strand:+ start:143 stop:379 length:237 start_codon:yes stop_codon:yes gene_type:complete